MAKKVSEQTTPKVETAPEVNNETPVVEQTATEVAPETVEPEVVAPEIPEETPEVIHEEIPSEKKSRASKKPEIPEVTPKTPIAKKVKIMCVADIDSNINGEKYIFPAKKIAEVPEDVAQILVHGGKAYRM